MLNKNYDLKTNRNLVQKIIFYTVLAIYICGLCCGCLFALKNSENTAFVSRITGVEKMVKNGNNTLFTVFAAVYIRDVFSLASVLVLKYSGVLKGMCVCRPFVAALQNGCVYIVNYHSGVEIYDLIVRYILKDTANGFLLILFCYVIVSDIINDRYNYRRDIAKFTVYITGITVVYIVDFIIKIFL